MPWLRKRGIPLVLFLWGWCTVRSAAREAKQLARVAILRYDDDTGTPNFGYLPGSLTEAIDKSLQRRFEYVREDPAKSETQRRKIKAKGIFNAREAAQYCARYDVQILVYGRFTYDPQNRQIAVDTWISLGTEKDHRQLVQRRSQTDASIFNLADKVADDIVREMTQIAMGQRSASVPAKGAKIELEKKTVPQWYAAKTQLAFFAGLTPPLSELGQAYHPGVAISVGVRHALFQDWYGLLDLTFTSLAGAAKESRNAYTTRLVLVPARVGGGYAWYFGNGRWRFDAESLLGLYAGNFTILASGENVHEKNFFNPTLGLNLSVHYLAWERLALGLRAGYLHLFDKGTQPGTLFLLQLGLAYVL